MGWHGAIASFAAADPETNKIPGQLIEFGKADLLFLVRANSSERAKGCVRTRRQLKHGHSRYLHLRHELTLPE
jgi:hypothetical protein